MYRRPRPPGWNKLKCFERLHSENDIWFTYRWVTTRTRSVPRHGAAFNRRRRCGAWQANVHAKPLVAAAGFPAWREAVKCLKKEKNDHLRGVRGAASHHQPVGWVRVQRKRITAGLQLTLKQACEGTVTSSGSYWNCTRTTGCVTAGRPKKKTMQRV